MDKTLKQKASSVSVCTWMGDRTIMSISVDSISDIKILNRGPLALLLQDSMNFPLGLGLI